MIIWDKNRVLREISSAQEIYESPAYIRVLDKNLHELNEIIGIYKLREDDEEVLCGFKDCRTRHQKGYLISTKSGNTANIGNFCGRKIFGVDFKTQINIFKREIKIKKERDFLIDFDAAGYEVKLNELLNGEHGARWMHQMITKIIEPPEVPEVIFKKIRDIKRTGNANISLTREATPEEKKRDRDMGKKVADYVDEVVGVLSYITALNEDFNLKRLLITESLEPIKKLQQLDIHALSRSELNTTYRAISSVPTNYEKAIEAMSRARGFLTKKNLSPLIQLINNGDKDAQKLFKRYLNQLPE